MKNIQQSTSKQFAELLDRKFRIPGTDIRFGLDPIIGLVPGIGDWIGGIASLYFLLYAAVLKAKTAVILRMLLNILMDIMIGTIPFLGDVFDMAWRANIRNAELLDELIHDPSETERASRVIVWSVAVFSVTLVLLLLWVIGLLLYSIIEILF